MVQEGFSEFIQEGGQHGQSSLDKGRYGSADSEFLYKYCGDGREQPCAYEDNE